MKVNSRGILPHTGEYILALHQKNFRYKTNTMNTPPAAIGPYWFNIACHVNFFAPHLNSLLWSTSLLLMALTFSSFSPRFSTSSIFLFIIFWMSVKSLFSLEELALEVGSTKSRARRWMSGSYLIKAYGRAAVSTVYLHWQVLSMWTGKNQSEAMRPKKSAYVYRGRKSGGGNSGRKPWGRKINSAIEGKKQGINSPCRRILSWAPWSSRLQLLLGKRRSNALGTTTRLMWGNWKQSQNGVKKAMNGP